MNGTFEFKLSNGSVCKLEAEYECIMKNESLDADGVEIIGELKPNDIGKSRLAAYVDGKKIDESSNKSFWKLIDIKTGAKKIWGLNVGFAKPEDANNYEKWIDEIIEGGKSDEVKAYEKAKTEKENKEKIERAKEIIAKAEHQKDIPSKSEAQRRMKQYNAAANEGGEGYVPYIVSVEEYEYAKKVISEFGGENHEN